MQKSQILLTGKAILLLIVASAPSAMAQLDLPPLINKVQPSVVFIRTYDRAGYPLSQGSGFFVSQAGELVTNRHLLRGAATAMVKTSDGRLYPVDTIIAEDKNADLVRVSITAPQASFDPLGLDVVLPKVGERIVVVGNPLGLEQSVSERIVSAIRTVVSREKIIQITAPISPGSSGSPVVNAKGDVIGVATFQLLGGQNLNFAIPALNVLRMRPRNERLARWSEVHPPSEIVRTPQLETAKYLVAVVIDDGPDFTDVPGYSYEMRTTIIEDLELIDEIRVVEADAKALISGELSVSGNKLNATLRLYDGYLSTILCREYSGDLRSSKDIAHDFADEVILQLTGVYPGGEQAYKKAPRYSIRRPCKQRPRK